MTDQFKLDQKQQVLALLEPFATSPLIERTKKWLRRLDTAPLAERTIEVRVGDVKALWRVRLDISQSKGRSVEGAPELLNALDRMNVQIKLEQRGFSSPGTMGNIFFRKSTREYVGTVLVPIRASRE